MNWQLQPDRAVIVSDTLITNGATGKPWFLAPKVLVLSHLSAIVAAKGAVAPVHALWVRLMTGGFAADVDELAVLAPGLLQEAYAAERGKLEEDECLVFLFGWSPARRRVVGWAFPFHNGFTAVELADGETMIPQRAQLPGSADWPATINLQHALELEIPEGDRDHCGGFLTSHAVVFDGSPKIVVENHGPLPSFAEQMAALPPPPPWPTRSQPDLVEWGRCEPWLAAALATDNGARTLADLREGCGAGRYALFPGEKSAVLVELVRDAWALQLHFYLAGGDLVEIRDVLRPQLEEYGQRLGCGAVFITGRKGWARAFGDCGYQLVREINAGRNWWLVGKELNPSGAPAMATENSAAE